MEQPLHHIYDNLETLKMGVVGYLTLKAVYLKVQDYRNDDSKQTLLVKSKTIDPRSLH